MAKRILLIAALMAGLAAAPAAAQIQVELNGFGGWTFSNGIDGNIAGGPARADITPLSAFSYGAAAGIWFNEYMEVGFNWSQQQSELRVRTRGLEAPLEDVNVTLDGFAINNYHGFFAYHWGYRNAPAKPFFMFGMGSTQYTELSTTRPNGDPVILPSTTRFSTTWALGVKLFPNNGKIGAMFMGRWTPTYITSDPGGVWCDPLWGCTSYANPKYSHQFELAAGLTIRFGETRRGF